MKRRQKDKRSEREARLLLLKKAALATRLEAYLETPMTAEQYDELCDATEAQLVEWTVLLEKSRELDEFARREIERIWKAGAAS
jgi:hypothetical protein